MSSPVSSVRDTALLHSVLNACTYAIISTDQDGVVTSFNQGAEAMLGYSSSEIVGIHTPSLWHDPAELVSRAAVLRMELDRPIEPDFGVFTAKIQSRGSSDEGDWTLRRKDGSRLKAHLSATAIIDGSDKIVGYLCVLHDITKQQDALVNLRISEQRFRDTVEFSAIGMATVALDGTWITINEALCDLLGYTQEELLGCTFQDITHPDDLEADLANVEDILSGRQTHYHMEKRYLHKNGRIVWALLSVSLVRDQQDKPSYFVSQIQDIAAQKKEQQELKRSNQELEQFAYIASHDLQEPLRAVAGCASMLEVKYQGRLDDEADKLISHVIDGARRMQALISDLLQLSRVNSHGVRGARVDVNKICKRVIANLQEAITSSRASIEFSDLPTVKADATQLQQLLQNLIGNALKYRKEEPPVITISAQKHTNHWEFKVTDNGIGIEPPYFERVFGVFQRLHTRDEYPGTGMGLALCKKIVERHGGKIWLESTPGRGSIFYFTIPLSSVLISS